MRASMSFIFEYINKKRWFLLGYLALVLECITPIIAAVLQRDIIDNVFTDKQYDQFAFLIILYAVFFFGPKLWFTVRKVTFFHMSYHLQMNLTEQFLKKIYGLPTAAFNKEHTGKLLNNIRNDISNACNTAVNEMLSESVKIIVSLIFLSVAIAYISLTMLLVVSVVAFIYYILLYKFGDKTKENAGRVRQEKAHLSVNIEESISSVRETVAYNLQNQQMNDFEEKFQKYYKALIEEGLYKIKILFISDPFLYTTKLTVILFGAINAFKNNVSLGEFVVSFTLVDQLVTGLGQLFQQGLIGKRLIASVDCVQSVMIKENLQYGHIQFNGKIESIEFRNVTFRYSEDSELVLENLNLDVPVGKKIAFVGESGSGKSTIAKLLLRAYEPEEGEVLINAEKVIEYNHQYADRITAVLQDPHFLPITIKENLIFDKDYEQKDIEDVCRKMLCFDFIQELSDGYETEVGERGTRLSGGQKQRLALARSMLKNADVLILDEATSALDIETEYHIQKNIDQLRKNMTTIIIAHRMTTVQNADVIFVLDKGRVITKGTHSELIVESPVYKSLYETQLKVS
ncbi:MAG: ABC transporter ATP-binding protein [Clostridiales bacterium]|nr:ABC transporter ATP-binding protein [Clostridiales bacterium]